MKNNSTIPVREFGTDYRSNLRLAKKHWPNEASKDNLESLKALTIRFRLSIASGDLLLLDGRWYITHTGLLRLAQRRRCHGIHTSLQKSFSDPSSNRWVFKATVYKSPKSRGFVGYGDADPTNVSSLVQGAELRVAETRAVNRALRKAYGIGLCSVEELGATQRREPPREEFRVRSQPSTPNGNGNGQPRLRDQLCQLLRQHNLDATLVKLYAADFCGTAELKDASKELVTDFISTLGEWAEKDRAGLICHLNSFSPQEVTP